MQVGVLELRMQADIARLVTDMDKAKRAVSDTVSRINGILGAIGVGVSFVGFTSMIKSVTDVGDHLNDLRKITGLTVVELGGLGKAAKLNGTDLDSVAKAVGLMSKNMYSGAAAFDTLGISTKDSSGQLRNAGQVFLDVADKFSKMEDGATKSALANAVFGKSGRELIPLLNEGRSALESNIESYAKYSGMTAQAAEESDRFNDILVMLNGRVTAIKTSFVAELLPTLNAIGTAMLNTAQSTGQFSFAANVVVPVLKGLAIAGFTVVDTFQGIGREIGARAAQLTALASLDFKNVAFIGKSLAEDNAKSRAEYDKFVKTIMDSDKSVNQLTETQKEYLKIEQQVPAAVEKTTKALKEKKTLTDAEQLALLRVNESTKRTIELSGKVNSVTQSVATEQEKYNQKLEELERLKPYLSVETYSRALQKAQDELGGVKDTAQKTFNDIDQYAVQASRNIQTSLANFLFNPFDDGLKGMVQGVANAARRMLAEFAAMRISNAIGLSSLFGLDSSAASASTGAGAAGGGLNLLNIASAGSGLMNLFKGGFGATSLLSSVGGMLPGSAGAFFGGMGGGAIAGVSSPAALMGSSFGAFLGPIAALGGIDMIGRMLAGDKKLGGAEMIPVIGGFLAAMFGRGPYKFRQQSLQGTVSSDGFDGDITNVFRSKGGLFVSNKHKSVTEQFSPEMQALFDSTIGGFFQAAHNASVNLGLDAALVDNFSKEIQIKSEKGQKLTEQAITDMLTGIGDDIAKAAFPIVDQFKKAGETSAQTLSRLSGEFTSLSDAASLIFGKSSADAKAMISGTSFAGRTAFVDAAGGTDALAQKAAFFSQNFFTSTELLTQSQTRLDEQLQALGLSSDLTKDQFRGLVQSFGQVGGISEDLLQSLLNLAPAFVSVRAAEEQLAAQVQQQRFGLNSLSGAFSVLQRSVAEEKNRITDAYNKAISESQKRIDEVTGSIAKLKSLSDALKSTTDALRPIGLTQARAQIQDAIANAKNGIFPDAAGIGQALSALSNQSTDRFASRFDFLSSRAQSAGLVDQLGALTANKMTDEQRMLEALQSSKDALTEGFNTQIAQLDGLITSAQQQIDIMNGTYVAIRSVGDAIGDLNRTLLQAGAGTIGDGHVSGNPAISNQAIADYFKSPRTPDEIFRDASQYGISSSQIMGATGFTQEQVDKFFADNPRIPRFATGSSYVPRTGLAIVHQGERIINPQQNGDIVDSLKTVAKKTDDNTTAINSLYRLLRNAMQETDTGMALTTASAT